MEYRNFGTSDVQVSSICLGTTFRVASDDNVWELDKEETRVLDEASAWTIGAAQTV